MKTGLRRAAPPWTARAGQPPLTPLRPIPAGTFLMGSDHHYPEEAPVRRVRVAAFAIEETAVTGRQFAAFVAATRYRTVAERLPDPRLYPGADPAALVPGALVFHMTAGPVDTRDPGNWWSFVPGACWHAPEGPGSTLAGREDHPVVCVAHADADAYARWAGRALPTEAEWEYAARGGLEGAEFAWGDTFAPGDVHLANTWQGAFPWQNTCADGFSRTCPVRSFPPNGYGLHEVCGNVWEWTTDWYAGGQASGAPGKPACCAPDSGTRGAGRWAATRTGSLDPTQPGIPIPRRVVKGGSFLCAPSWCRRYRPAARHPQMIDTGTSHIGFRCVLRGSEGSRGGIA